jgi:cytidine deaminase
MESFARDLIDHRKKSYSRMEDIYVHRHIACIFDCGTRPNLIHELLSLGINYTVDDKTSVHAEQDAISKLKQKNKIYNIDILILRYNKGGEFLKSNPCMHCIYYMYRISLIKGYEIKNVYISTDDNKIQKYKFANILYDPKQYITHYNQINKRYEVVEKLQKITGITYEIEYCKR